MSEEDWADEETKQIFRGWEDPNNFRVDYDADVSDALRSAYHRGRVAGLRKAEELAIVAHFSGLAKMFRSAADKLEAEKP